MPDSIFRKVGNYLIGLACSTSRSRRMTKPARKRCFRLWSPTSQPAPMEAFSDTQLTRRRTAKSRLPQHCARPQILLYSNARRPCSKPEGCYESVVCVLSEVLS